MYRVCVSPCSVWTSMLSNIFLMPFILCEHLRVVCFSLISLRGKVLWVAEGTLLLFTIIIIIHTSHSFIFIYFFMTKRTCWKMYRSFFPSDSSTIKRVTPGSGRASKGKISAPTVRRLLPACRWSQVSNGQVYLFHTLIKPKTHTPEPLVVAWVTASVERPSLGNKTLLTTKRTYLWCALHTFYLYLPYTLETVQYVPTYDVLFTLSTYTYPTPWRLYNTYLPMMCSSHFLPIPTLHPGDCTIRTYLWCALHTFHLYLPYTLETVQ